MSPGPTSDLPGGFTPDSTGGSSLAPSTSTMESCVSTTFWWVVLTSCLHRPKAFTNPESSPERASPTHVVSVAMHKRKVILGGSALEHLFIYTSIFCCARDDARGTACWELPHAGYLMIGIASFGQDLPLYGRPLLWPEALNGKGSTCPGCPTNKRRLESNIPGRVLQKGYPLPESWMV